MKVAAVFNDFLLPLYNYKRPPEKKIHFITLDQKLISYNMVIYFHKLLYDNVDVLLHSTFKRKINQLIQGGFFNHWFDPYLNHRSMVENEVTADKIVLTMDLLTPGFTIWLSVLLIALIAFIVELIRFYFRNFLRSMLIKRILRVLYRMRFNY